MNVQLAEGTNSACSCRRCSLKTSSPKARSTEGWRRPGRGVRCLSFALCQGHSSSPAEPCGDRSLGLASSCHSPGFAKRLNCSCPGLARRSGRSLGCQSACSAGPAASDAPTGWLSCGPQRSPPRRPAPHAPHGMAGPPARNGAFDAARRLRRPDGHASGQCRNKGG